MSRVLVCTDIPDAPPCCLSCHEDLDLGYGDMLEVWSDDLGWEGCECVASICCRVYTAEEERGFAGILAALEVEP